MKQIRNMVLTVVLLGASAPASSIDTDIFMSPLAIPGAPLVMITIDWRSNLGSTVCSNDEDMAKCQVWIDEGYLTPADPTKIDFFELFKASLKRAIEPLTGVSLGLMIGHEANNCAGPTEELCSNGGYILSGFKDVEDPVERAEFFAKLDAIPLPKGNQAHTYQGREIFFELFRYLTGQGVYNGHNGWNDYGTDDTWNLDDPEDWELTPTATLKWDSGIEVAGDAANPDGIYVSPLPDAQGCSGVYTLNVIFQDSTNEDDSDEAIYALKSEGGMGGPAPEGIVEDNTFTTMLSYLHDVDLADGSFNPDLDLPGKQNVTSYFLSPKDNSKIHDFATAGGTGRSFVLAENPDDLYASLNAAFAEIMGYSTTLTSPAVPVNIFNRARTLNDLYTALFRADTESKPRWNGNLKKLKIAKDSSTGDLVVVDVNGDYAVAADGRIKHSALTYWTHTEDLPDPVPDDDLFLPGKDGRTVPRGGAGGVVPGFRPLTDNTPGLVNPVGTATETTTRKLFTEPDSHTNGIATDLRPFVVDDATVLALLTTSDSADALYQAVMGCDPCDYGSAGSSDQGDAEVAVEELITWARGLDTQDDDLDGDTDDTRSWLISDALHSRPIAINFGAIGSHTQDNPDVRVVMGSNDGFVRMFDTDDNSGVELWAFTPRAVIPKMQRLKLNSLGTPLHPYLVDGSPAVLTIDTNSDGTLNHAVGDRVIVFFGLRRGGKRYYALDISNPDDPHMLWSIDNADTDFTELGQSWSKPRIAKMWIDADDNAATTGDVSSYSVLMFGGGYNGDDGADELGDLGKDARDDATGLIGSDDDEGNAVFIVNALTGELLWKAVKTGVSETTGPVIGNPKLYKHTDLHDSIPSDLSIADTTGNGYIDRMYVGDTGGKVWRADFPGSLRSSWTLTPILSVGRHFNNTNADDRRFFHRVDFVQSRDSTGDFDAVVVGSGDRPHPLGENVLNYVYMLKDRNTQSGDPPATVKDHDDLADLTDNCLQDGDSTDCADSDVDTKIADGWRIKLENCPAEAIGDCGEKSLAQPLTVAGDIFFTTFVPPEEVAEVVTCEPVIGTGLFYRVSLFDASAVVNFNTSNDSGDTETLERFETMRAGGIPSQLVPLGDGHLVRSDLQIEDTVSRTSAKTYWYETYRR